MSFEKTLNDTDLRVLRLATSAYSNEVESTLTQEEYEAVTEIKARLEDEDNKRDAVNSVLLVDVPPGSIWVEGGAKGLVGCKWPTALDGHTCSYTAEFPCWSPDTERVHVLAQGLDDAKCCWVLQGAFASPRTSACTESMCRRCAHLMSGGTIESYVEAT
jgi:hypothetical protein